jgi:transcriptional regulator with XRE-family HTH domain
MPMTATVSDRVASNVRAELARRRLSQQALAAALGVSQTHVSRRLVGKVAFDVEELHAVADFLGLRVAALLATTSSGADVAVRDDDSRPAGDQAAGAASGPTSAPDQTLPGDPERPGESRGPAVLASSRPAQNDDVRAGAA